MTMYFNKTQDRQWEWHGMCDGKEVSGGREGKMSQVASGKHHVSPPTENLIPNKFNNANFTSAGGALPNQKIDISFGDAITTNKGKGLKGTVQFGKESDLLAWKQDGSAAGTITNMSFSDTGILSSSLFKRRDKGFSPNLCG